jgi:hypothetical protein
MSFRNLTQDGTNSFEEQCRFRQPGAGNRWSINIRISRKVALRSQCSIRPSETCQSVVLAPEVFRVGGQPSILEMNHLCIQLRTIDYHSPLAVSHTLESCDRTIERTSS